MGLGYFYILLMKTMTKIILCLIQFLVSTTFQFVPTETFTEDSTHKNSKEIKDAKAIKKSLKRSSF
jgi:hypothetical protein